jgi:hypothetical protein
MSLSDVLSATGRSMGEVNVSLSTTSSPEELWAYWEDLNEVRRAAADLMKAMGSRWEAVPDSLLKDRLWTEFRSACREYNVIAAWQQVIHATYVFMTEGAAFGLLDDGAPTPF